MGLGRGGGGWGVARAAAGAAGSAEPPRKGGGGGGVNSFKSTVQEALLDQIIGNRQYSIVVLQAVQIKTVDV